MNRRVAIKLTCLTFLGLAAGGVSPTYWVENDSRTSRLRKRFPKGWVSEEVWSDGSIVYHGVYGECREEVTDRLRAVVRAVSARLKRLKGNVSLVSVQRAEEPIDGWNRYAILYRRTLS